MIIYQLNPTIVAKINDEILKIFPDEESCEEEFNSLRKVTLPLVEKHGTNEYEMSLVETLGRFKSVLIMAHVDGLCMSDSSSMSHDISYLIGEYLAKFHLVDFDVAGLCGPKLYGDFSINHIYVDFQLKTITLIDPGKNFMVQGNQLEDVVRFMFSVIEAFRYRPFYARAVIKKFINGYSGLKPIDGDELKSIINLRKKRSIEKYHLQKSPFRARLGTLILNYNRMIIWLVTKC